MNKYLDNALRELNDQYKLDGIVDVLLLRDDRVVLYADITKSPITLQVVSGSLSNIGYDDNKAIHLKEFFASFDHFNKYAEVAGIEEYYNGIHQKIVDFKTPSNVSFPIVTNNGRFWIRMNSVPIKNNSNLIAFYITDVTQYLIDEEMLFDKTHRDSLTQLFNKYTLDYHFGVRYKNDDFHVFFLDLDNFKTS